MRPCVINYFHCSTFMMGPIIESLLASTPLQCFNAFDVQRPLLEERDCCLAVNGCSVDAVFDFCHLSPIFGRVFYHILNRRIFLIFSFYPFQTQHSPTLKPIPRVKTFKHSSFLNGPWREAAKLFN